MDARAIETAEFPAVDEARWRKLAEAALKGEASETLVSRTDDGVSCGPISRRRTDGHAIARRDAGRPWRISQRIDDTDAARAADQALAECRNGADSLTLVMSATAGAFGFGLPMPAGPAFAGIFEKVDAAEVTLRLEGSALAARALADRLAASASKTVRPEVHFGIDPVSASAFAGEEFGLDARLSALLDPLRAAGFGGTLLRADGRLAHNAGATEAQELGVVLSALAAYLRAGEAGGLALEEVFAQTELAIAADQNQFLSIAKLRALRLLHARLQTACGIERPAAASIHAETSFRMLTRADPETNILRNTIAAFAAGVGGADSVAVLPHTLACGLPDAFARRIARNTQMLLIHESHLDHVVDPSAGAGGIEDLTDALAAAAWTEFQAIEAEGGIMRSLETGALQRRIGEARARRAAAIAAGKRPIVGTTLYPPKEEQPVTVFVSRDVRQRAPAKAKALGPSSLHEAWKGAAA
ncbi:MAG: methylmalonyl-CoA mutase family protein [Pararhizobium sp.]